MSWGEFCTLLAGVMPETPLGQIVSIRSEKHRETVKHFTKEQHRIRNEWRSRPARLARMNKDEAGHQVRAFQEMCRRAFGK